MDNLRKELDELATKYNLSKAVLICEQQQKGKVKNRVILFKSRNVYAEPFLCDYADLISNCITTSKTFMNLLDHFWAHSIHDALQVSFIKQNSEKPD